MEGARVPGAKIGRKAKLAEKSKDKLLEKSAHLDAWQQIEVLEKDMFEAAKNLEFEKAASIRDLIQTLKTQAE